MPQVINIQSIVENEIDLSQARSMVILHKGEIYKFFDEGTTRYVFVNENDTKIIKINKRDSSGFNEKEFEIYKDAKQNDRDNMVETNLFNNIIEQPFCTPIKFGGKRLSDSERKFAISCRNEVGWSEGGKLLCFDLDEYKKY